jgi:hypothetical protein
MDLSRFLQFLLIATFSAAVALIGLHDLSHRFVKSAGQKGELPAADKLIKHLHGEISVIKPHEGRPTPEAKKASEQSEGGAAAYGAVQSGAKQLADKLLP